jgi:transcriptional regulator with XRE-family HTH domain
VAAEIRRTRHAAGLTQRELAARLNKGAAWIAAVEGGRRHIDLEELDQISQALGIDPLELLKRAM